MSVAIRVIPCLDVHDGRAVVAMFAGWIGHEAFQIIRPQWATFMAGLFGWLGADGIKWAVEQILKKDKNEPKT